MNLLPLVMRAIEADPASHRRHLKQTIAAEQTGLALARAALAQLDAAVACAEVTDRAAFRARLQARHEKDIARRLRRIEAAQCELVAVQS